MQKKRKGDREPGAAGSRPISNAPPRSDEAKSSRSDRYYAWAVCGFLLLTVGLIYGQTLDHVLVDYDDSGFVYANPHVRAGLTLEGIKWAFTEGPYGEWYPLAPLSHMLDCQLFDLAVWGHHLTSVLLHAAGSILLFLVWWRMTDELWPSAFVAAVFAVHPQHVESVAWVAERRDVLCGLFFMLTLATYLGYVRHGRSLGRYVLVAAMLALGLMAKPMLVTVPPLLLLLDFWPLARIGAASDTPDWTHSIERPGLLRLVLEKIPLFALAVGDCLMTLRTHNAVVIVLPWSVRISNAATSCIAYIRQFFYPVDLAVFYPYPKDGFPIGSVVSCLVILVVVSGAAVIWRRRCPYLFVGWFWFLGMLSPVIGLISVSDHAMADRYMYLPSIGLSIALTWGAVRLCAGSPNWTRVLTGGSALAVGVLAVYSVWQTSYWHDDETLWRHALSCTAASSEAELALADALARQSQFDEAIDYYERAQKHPLDAMPFNNLGKTLAGLGDLNGAIAQYRLALLIDPKSALVHANLAAALGLKAQFEEAMKHALLAIELDPLATIPHVALAHLYAYQKKMAEARTELYRVIEMDPFYAGAENDLGSTFLDEGNLNEAMLHYRRALQLDPKMVLAHTNLAEVLVTLGKVDEAIPHYRRALELEPNNKVALSALEKLLGESPSQTDQPKP
jgi:protein O-mannosyl-transferase